MLALAAAAPSVANAVYFENEDTPEGKDEGPQKVARAILMISLQKGWLSSYLRLLSQRKDTSISDTCEVRFCRCFK